MIEIHKCRWEHTGQSWFWLELHFFATLEILWECKLSCLWAKIETDMYWRQFVSLITLQFDEKKQRNGRYYYIWMRWWRRDKSKNSVEKLEKKELHQILLTTGPDWNRLDRTWLNHLTCPNQKLRLQITYYFPVNYFLNLSFNFYTTRKKMPVEIS